MMLANPDNHRVNMTLPHHAVNSKTQQQVIGEKPQEEEETVERGKEEGNHEKSLYSIKRSADSPERHAHESNHRREED